MQARQKKTEQYALSLPGDAHLLSDFATDFKIYALFRTAHSMIKTDQCSLRYLKIVIDRTFQSGCAFSWPNTHHVSINYNSLLAAMLVIIVELANGSCFREQLMSVCYNDVSGEWLQNGKLKRQERIEMTAVY